MPKGHGIFRTTIGNGKDGDDGNKEDREAQDDHELINLGATGLKGKFCGKESGKEAS